MNRVSALSGVRVLEIGEGWTCALAGRLLMDMGADVRKLEIPWGDSLRSYGRDHAERRAAFELPNRGKQVVAGGAVLERLRSGADEADVLMIDAAAARRLDIDVSAVGPRTVVCRFSPFDINGPLAAMTANDLTLQAMSGVMATTGEPGGRPLRSGTELSDAVGALYGTIGVMAALIERERSALGQIVDVSLYDCLVATLTNFASRVLGGVEPLGLLGNQGPNSAPWELFEASDGEFVFIIAGSNPTFTRLTEVMGRPELLEDPRFATHGPRRDHYETITAVVGDWARTLPRDEIVSLLRANGVPVSPVASVKEVLADRHLRSRGLLAPHTDESHGLTVGQPFGFPSVATNDAGRRAVQAADAARAGESTRLPPLSGVRVVDLGTLTAGPYCTRLFANLGADVLKIEPPDGEPGRLMPPIVDGESVFFHISNNGKRSLRANLRDPDDVAMVAEVLSQADVMISNQAPGGLEKRGLGSDRMLADAPNLIYTTVSGFGNEGVFGGLRAYDTVIQAATGLMSLTGEEDGRPLKTGISTADVLGSLAAATASLAAYFGRVTGRNAGLRLDVALYDICAWSTQMSWVSERSNLPGAIRHGNGHWLFAPYGVFAAGDEQSVAIACESDTQWRGLAEALAAQLQTPKDFEYWDRAERWTHRSELDKLLQSFCAAYTRDEVVGTLQARGVPCGPVVDVQDVLTTRQHLARTTVDTLSQDGRFWRVTDFPIRLSATPGAVSTPAPPLGSHDHQIRQNPEMAWTNVVDNEETGIRVSK